MRVLDMRSYEGRNIYSHKPVIKMIIDIDRLAEIPSNQMIGFNEELLNLFPGLKQHYCSTGYEGGFCERLKEGTYLSHVTEHLALELQCLLGYDIYFGKTRVLEDPTVYCIIYEYINKEAALACGRAAVRILSALADRQRIFVDEILESLQRTAQESELGPSTKAIFKEAKKRSIPVQRIGRESLLQLGTGKFLRFMEASLPDSTSCIAVDLAKNKQLAKQLLRDYNIPVPPGEIVYSEEEAVILAEEIGYPVVIKPCDGNQGKGVTINIEDKYMLRSAFRLAKSYSYQILLEKHYQGNDYRVLVVGDKVAAVAERKPPYVIGDGTHSIAELVDLENQHPDRGQGHEKPLTKISLDEVVRDWLDRFKLHEYSIPAQGEWVSLRENGNLSTGGQARDVTADIHPVTQKLAVKAAQLIGLEVAGIDLIIEDISQALTAANGAIIEVNAAPGLRMHLHPSQGTAKNVAADILDYLFPPGTPSTVPIVAVTGSNGKTTVTRLLNHVLSLTGKETGMACSSGTYIKNECIAKGDHTGPLSARRVLSHREIEIAVLETARGGIIKRGLGYDLADVGVVINVSEDHLGLDDVHTLQEMAFVKSLVVEAVKPDGYAVLNAEDAMTPYIAERVTSKLVYFSQNRQNPIINTHINQGERAIVLEDNLLVRYEEGRRVPLLRVEEIPITFSGKLSCNIENALAAAASLWALGISDKVIAWGLKTFRPDPWANAGRFNLFSLGDFQVLLDYGHNLRGYQAVGQLIKSMDAARLVGVIGMPGDRSDEAILEVGQYCGQLFSSIYIKEDTDLRGRKTGETAGLLFQGAASAGVSEEDIVIIHSELDALEAALDQAQAGDLIVIFYEDFNAVFQLIQNHIPQEEALQILPLLMVENKEPDVYAAAERLH